MAAKEVGTPSISIFIVNYNTRALLERCLRSIFDTKGDLRIEVFVGDNDSSDGSGEMVRGMFPRVSLTRYSKNMGYTQAINPLLPLAKAQYCLLMHPDLEILPNTFEEFLQFFESHPEAGILGGNLFYPDGTPNPCEILFPGVKNDLLCFAERLFRKLLGAGAFAREVSLMEWSHKATSQVNWVWNACMIVRTEVFDRIGYFDDDFFVWYADWDLCKRAAEAGWSTYYLRQATAIHHERQSFVNEGITKEEVVYKVDGWYSAPQQISDRHVFLKKHTGAFSIIGIKTVSIVENAFRLLMILGNVVSRRSTFKEASFPIGMCLQTIQAILKA